MLPPKVKKFIASLLQRTNSGQMIWTYDDWSSTASFHDPTFAISIKYSFNDNKEIGEFSIGYTELPQRTEYRFFTDQYWEKDYELVAALYSAAQASQASFPF